MSQNFVRFFVFNIKKSIAWCISVKKNYHNLTKNDHKFQASATKRCTSLRKSSRTFGQNPLETPMKKLDI